MYAMLKLQKHVEFGQNIYVLGDMNSWKIEEPIPMVWTEGDWWVCELNLQIGDRYRYIIKWADKIIWENGSNRVYTHQEPIVIDYWNLREVQLKVKYNKPLQVQVIGQYLLNLSQSDNESQEISLFVDANELESLKYFYVNGEKKEKNNARKIKGKEVMYVNNKIVKNDRNIDFELKFSQITENIMIGPYIDNENDILQLKGQGVDAILSLQTSYDCSKRAQDVPKIKSLCNNNGILRKKLEIVDRCDIDLLSKGIQAYNLLDKIAQTKKKIYVHCTRGIYRSVHVVILYLILSLNYSFEDAVSLVRTQRNNARIDTDLIQKMLEEIN